LRDVRRISTPAGTAPSVGTSPGLKFPGKIEGHRQLAAEG
jgi:hypothetical protein